MTSEVVVMNRMGVALAADSAATIEMGENSKLRNSALKLFMLSKYRPVGVMVYNNADLLGVPLETIIKLFRRGLGRRSFGTVAEYGNELIDFLDGNASLFPESVQDRYFLAALETECGRIGELIEQEFLDRELYGDPSLFPEVVERVIAARLRSWTEQEDAEYFKHMPATHVVGRISGKVHEVVHRAAASWGVGSSEVVDNLYEIARHLVAKDYFPSDVYSGLVIAGFGEDEHFPAVMDVQIGGVYGDRLKVRPASLVQVSDERPSHVMAFAYTDMVDAFLNGISPDGVAHLVDAAAFIREMPLLALDTVTGLSPEEKERVAGAVRRASQAKAREFAQNVLEASDNREEEIKRVVETLTIGELAKVASTLVGLSSFEHQMSLDRESVGGPVDVAVISKGDGFIWIDRKHYFRREFNEHFFRNYRDDAPAKDDVGGGEEEPDDE